MFPIWWKYLKTLVLCVWFYFSTFLYPKNLPCGLIDLNFEKSTFQVYYFPWESSSRSFLSNSNIVSISVYWSTTGTHKKRYNLDRNVVQTTIKHKLWDPKTFIVINGNNNRNDDETFASSCTNTRKHMLWSFPGGF